MVGHRYSGTEYIRVCLGHSGSENKDIIWPTALNFHSDAIGWEISINLWKRLFMHHEVHTTLWCNAICILTYTTGKCFHGSRNQKMSPCT